MAREEGALLFRIRWYGELRKRVFFERKTHHEKWIMDSSVKERFELPLDQLDAFMAGRWTPTLRDFEGKAAAEMLALALEMQGTSQCENESV